MLVVFGGLPGTGKTTIARALAERHAATYLRIDAIEQAIRASNVLAGEIGPAGYAVANALAEANLSLGRTVVADCVNPVAESRAAWRRIAARAGVPLIEIEILCSDPVEHRRRVETRTSDIAGLSLPDWESILERRFEPWHERHHLVDTAGLSPQEAIAAVEACIAREVAGIT